jgi:hypothetical protein
MSIPRSRERMNKNSQNEFRFTSQDDLQIACTRAQSRGPARAVVQFMNDPRCFPALQPKSTESFLAASIRLVDADALSKTRSGLPMYPFSGSEYPIGRQLQGIRTLIHATAKLESALSPPILTKEGGTMLNELNGGQVQTYILVWLSSVLHHQSRNREALWPR